MPSHDTVNVRVALCNDGKPRCMMGCAPRMLRMRGRRPATPPLQGHNRPMKGCCGRLLGSQANCRRSEFREAVQAVVALEVLLAVGGEQLLRADALQADPGHRAGDRATAFDGAEIILVGPRAPGGEGAREGRAGAG